MKVLAKIFVVSIIASVLAGCASNSAYVPPIPPMAKAQLLEYFKQPDNKVFIIAVDPNGEFAYGSGYGKSTVKQAAKVAVDQCDAGRQAYGIGGQPYVYAINNKVVYDQVIQNVFDAKK